jgi:hypothetical protein
MCDLKLQILYLSLQTVNYIRIFLILSEEKSSLLGQFAFQLSFLLRLGMHLLFEKVSQGINVMHLEFVRNVIFIIVTNG